MGLDSSTSAVMTHLIATSSENRESADDLRRIAGIWIQDLPVEYLRQVGEILLRSHLDEQRTNAGLN
jgi:hypothetical protein